MPHYTSLLNVPHPQLHHMGYIQSLGFQDEIQIENAYLLLKVLANQIILPVPFIPHPNQI